MTETVLLVDPTQQNSDGNFIAAAEVPFLSPEEQKWSWLDWGGWAPKRA